MNDLVTLSEKPKTAKLYLIAGWRQWADAGAISSGLPEYLIRRTGARKIGHIQSDGFYLFQIPGTHHLLRPVIKLSNGYRQSYERKRNEFFYTGDEEHGLVIFLGDEPHMNVEAYSAAFFTAVKSLGVRRVAAVGGVYGSMPYDKERHISCVYSHPHLQTELEEYALRFSDYEGGSTIGTFLADQAELEDVEFIDLYAFVPAYDFSQSPMSPQGISIEQDYKAWYDVLRRLSHMFGLRLDLSDLQANSSELIASMDAKMEELEQQLSQFNIRDYMDRLDSEFTELNFMPLTDVWAEGLRGLFGEADEE